MHDVVIIGAGASAVGAMLGLVKQGVKPLLLDVGFAPTPPRSTETGGNLYRVRQKKDVFDIMIGEELQGLHNVIHGDKRPPKMIAPEMKYVMRDNDDLLPRDESGFTPFVSFARGGLGSAWGCGLFRSVAQDLLGLPITLDDLDPYFDQLTQKIGICGRDDDLRPYFGKADGLMPPLSLSSKGKKLLVAYEKKRDVMSRHGVHAGFSRLAVLSEAKDGREPLRYDNMEMWQAENPALYNPYYTIEMAVKNGQAEYQPGWLALSFKSFENHVEITARSTSDNSQRTLCAKTLILASGAINTAKLALNSRQDHRSRLPLFDNPLYQIPIIFPHFIGTALETDCFAMTQINLVFDLPKLGLLLQGSAIELTSPPRAALMEMFPLSARGNLALARYLAPAAMVLFLYFPIDSSQGGTISLAEDRLLIQGQPYPYPKKALKKVLSSLLRLGVLTLSPLVQKAINGYAVHYAGPLPMREKPHGEYECHKSGRLAKEKRIYVADGSLFSRLPAKNSSFMMMANAMRIGDLLGRNGG